MVERREFIEPLELRPAVGGLADAWDASVVRFVRNFENPVYELRRAERTAFLRLTPASHHSFDEVWSELDFVRFLGARGVPCAQPVPSRSESLLLEVEAAGRGFTACVFEEAPGSAYDELDDPDHASLFFDAGRVMARVHLGGGEYEPPPGFVRFSWRDDRWGRFDDLVPPTEREAWSLFEALSSWLEGLPTGPDHYGLIHGDFTIANLRIDDGAVRLYDFDSCCHHWHAYEIAMFLHYFGAREHLRDLAWRRVLEGYDSVKPVDDELISQIPMFGKMRLLYSFLVFANEWGFDDLDDEQHAYFDLRRRLFAEPPTWPPGRPADGDLPRM